VCSFLDVYSEWNCNHFLFYRKAIHHLIMPKKKLLWWSMVPSAGRCASSCCVDVTKWIGKVQIVRIFYEEEEGNFLSFSLKRIGKESWPRWLRLLGKMIDRGGLAEHEPVVLTSCPRITISWKEKADRATTRARNEFFCCVLHLTRGIRASERASERTTAINIRL